MSKNKEASASFDIKAFAKDNSETLITVGGLILLVVFFSIAAAVQGNTLWSGNTLTMMLRDAAPYMILAVAAVFIYSMGYMDVSLGAQLGVFGILTVYTINQTGSILLGFLLSAAVALLCGLLNGTVSVFLKLPSIVTSIFLNSIFGGLQLLLVQTLSVDETHTTGQDIISVNRTYKTLLTTLKQPWVIGLILVAFVTIAIILFRFTKTGKYIKAIGANETTTAQCGVKTTVYKTLGYSVLAIGIAIAAVFLMVPQTGQISKQTGNGMAMEVMLCLILGGMPMSGGMKSKITCAIVGVLIYEILNWGLNICFSQLANYKYLINAALFIVVILITSRQKGNLLPR